MSSTVRIRVANPSDLLACTEVWRSTVDRTLPPAAEAYGLYGHERVTGTLLVAERADEVVGFGASITRAERWFLADLFVSPDAHGAGIGRRLVDDLLILDRPGAVRATMASSDVRALSLYAKLGMTPRWPCFVMRSGPAGVTTGGLTTEPGQVRTVDADQLLGAAAGAGYALDRVDLEYWQREVETDLHTVHDNTGTAIGGAVVRWSTPFSIADPSVISVGPLFAESPAALPAVAAGVLDRVAERSAGRRVKLYVPGPSPLFAPLLDAGFSIVDFDHFACSADDVIDPRSVFPSHDLL